MCVCMVRCVLGFAELLTHFSLLCLPVYLFLLLICLLTYLFVFFYFGFGRILDVHLDLIWMKMCRNGRYLDVIWTADLAEFFPAQLARMCRGLALQVPRMCLGRAP